MRLFIKVGCCSTLSGLPNLSIIQNTRERNDYNLELLKHIKNCQDASTPL